MKRGALAVAALLAVQAPRAASPLASVEIVGVAPLPGMGVERKTLPYAVQMAADGALARADGDNLSEFLSRSFTGVNMNEISGSPFQNDLTFRGFRASPVLGTGQGISVYLDGVRVNEPFGDVVNWDMLPEAAIGSVLLAPGSNPLYGLNTLGGALALNTRSGASHPGLEGGVMAGSHKQRRADLAYGAGADGWHAFAAGTLFGDGGWRAHSDGRLGNLFVKLGRVRAATEWQLTMLGGESRLVGNGLLPDGLYEDERRAAYTYPDETRNRLRQTQFSVTQRPRPDVQLTGAAYLRNSRRDTVNGDVSDAYGDYVEDCGEGFHASGAPREPDECGYTRARGGRLNTASLNTTSTRQRSHGLSAQLAAQLPGHQLMAGLTYDRSKVRFAQYEQEADFTPERAVAAEEDEERELDVSVVGSSRSAGFYFTDTWTLRPGTWLTMSARHNHARVANTLSNGGVAQPAEAFIYRKFNPALGIAHEAAPGWTVFANLAQSNRVPTVIELGCADPDNPCRLPVGLQSDPYLKQVVSRTAEAGARWQSGRDTVTATVYRTVNRDDILFHSAGLTQHGYFSNFDRTRHQGLDLSAGMRRGPLTARLGYSWLDAVYAASGELFTGTRRVMVEPGTRIAGLPRHTLKLGLDWKASDTLTLSADMRAVSSLVTQGNEDGLAEDAEDGEAPKRADLRIRGHALLSLRLSYKPDRNWELYARVNNVANRRYETYGSVGVDMFPNGRLLRPHVEADEAGLARFVAPGAPRSFMAGLRYKF
ncbi:TonB-dependent receptor [Pseudoduganella namucuonensis]|uniref:Outer membrane insertion C-terminal signal n=1 Tax=Pseudoduganella namucuonensis TaxID=1035707 RepID=A0A1I7M782_9BURK|nr:TonB-dependent receptor [Pseudoduganella namucuonensis]SFV17809.1 outer membrane insertion C-terminal signal [Pseudoduganella namucuonensis]